MMDYSNTSNNIKTKWFVQPYMKTIQSEITGPNSGKVGQLIP